MPLYYTGPPPVQPIRLKAVPAKLILPRRRFLLACLAPIRLRAADSFDWAAFFGQLSAALSESNARAFLRQFDQGMKGYGELELAIHALVSQYAVGNEIEKLGESGEGNAREMELDWFLEILDKDTQMALVQRRMRVKCTVTKKGRQWRITSFEPLALFSLPSAA
jgi:hypothetical protein